MPSGTGAGEAGSSRIAGDRCGRRIPALDGFRGLMTAFVVASHYFAEIRGGVPRAGVGFVAVDAFFVLSGLLVGRLILDKGGAANFLQVFYARRACRTFPIYLVCVGGALVIGPHLGLPTSAAVPPWGYLAFLPNVFMAARDAVGTEWLGPTWTMGVEEHFYLLAPGLMLATPRRCLLPALATVAVAGVVVRAVMVAGGWDGIAVSTLLPTRADDLAIGLACAPLLATGVDWASTQARAAPIALMAAFVVGRAALGPAFVDVAGHTLVCLAVALFLMGLVRGAPEAWRFEGRAMAFLGTNSYAIYLTHVPILWIAHRVVLGGAPSLASPAGSAVTVACIPVTLAVAVVLTVIVEAPITELGRRMRWDVAPVREFAPVDLTQVIDLAPHGTCHPDDSAPSLQDAGDAVVARQTSGRMHSACRLDRRGLSEFLKQFPEKEALAPRPSYGHWAWVVPPMGGDLSPIRRDNTLRKKILEPNYLHQPLRAAHSTDVGRDVTAPLPF